MSTNRIIGKPKILQPLIVNGCGEIKIEDSVILGVSESPAYFSGYGYIDARKKNSSIEIAPSVVINNNVVIISNGSKIQIGEKTLIGLFCTIIDSDFHGIEPDKRSCNYAQTEPVKIGKNVFIGNNVQILKGVTIGNNSVIASGAIVAASIPANVVAGGIPAKPLRELSR